MKVLKNIILGLAVSLSVLFFGSCSGISKIKDIKVTSCGVESYSLKGLRSIDAVLAIGIDNPAMAFTVTDLSGILKYNGEDVAFYTADTDGGQEEQQGLRPSLQCDFVGAREPDASPSDSKEGIARRTYYRH